MTEGTRWLKRSIDYLGNIRERLGDLAGYDTLANELIQNAEDARATRIVFNLSDVALTVDNDARFSDCGLVGDQRECPWEKQHKPSCDWHNLTWIAAGQKRGREETIGKFGVGFLAVYQITDLPTIVSGRHWELHEEKEEAERIKDLCRSGCGHFPNVDGTRFVFPYATDPESRLRRQLGQQLLDWRAPDQLQEALVRAAPQALLFMRHLTKVEIRRDGTIAFAVERLAEAGKSMTTQLIVAGNAEETWYLLDGDFDDRAAELKQEFGAERIEPVRHARVRLAVPGSGTTNGVLYTGLPTATATGLPFHIDSTFFPSSDRKRVIADSADYRTLWNQAAMEAAGHALAQHVLDLRQPLGHAGYWGLINGVGASRASAAESRLVASGNFWSLLAERVRTTESAYDSTGRWVTPSAAPVLLRAEEADSLPALDAIGLHPMHEDVRKIVAAGQLVMRDLGTHWLTADAVVGAIRAVGLVSRRGAEWAPGNLGTVSGLTVLWTEIEALLAAAVAQNRSTDAAENDLRQCAIALTTDAQLIPLREVHRADPRTRQLLEAIGADVPLLHAEMDTGDGRLLSLCPPVDVSSIVAAIEKLDGDDLQGRWESDQYDPSALLDWLAPRLGELDEDPRLVERLRALPLFPAGRELGSLSQLAIPGDFQDPLGLADVISLPNLSRHRQTLIALRVRELTIGEFARVQVPRAFRDGDLEPSLIRRVVNVLAAHVASLEDDADARKALLDVPFIECIDGIFRPPSEVVADTPQARSVLGAGGPLVLRPGGAAFRHQQLWAWLSIAQEPTAGHVTARIDSVLNGPLGSAEQRTALETVCIYLNGRIREPEFASLVDRLKSKAWLPARDDAQWHKPSEIFAVFQDYLFETQAKFLAFARLAQNQITDLMAAVGIQMRPPTRMIVDHLLACAEAGKPVNRQVWEALSQAAADPAIQALRRRRCLMVEGDDGGYRRPDEVFWRGPSFGGLRVLLGPELSRYRPFLDAIGVKDAPENSDAIAVLREVRLGQSDRLAEALDEAALVAVHEAWSLISDHLDDPSALAIRALSTEASAVGRGSQLFEPRRLYIEDRPGLPEKFPAEIQERIVGFDPAIARGLRAAGARDLSEVVKVFRVDEGDTRPAAILDSRLKERWTELRRVIEGLGAEADAGGILSLEQFSRLEVDDLVVKYELPDEPGSPSSAAEWPKAIYIPGERCLYVRGAGDYPWLHVAREMAVALCGARSAPSVAPGFFVVLRAASKAEAGESLDELGVARVVGADVDSVPTEAMATALGGVDTGAGEDVDTPRAGDGVGDRSITPTPVGGRSGTGGGAPHGGGGGAPSGGSAETEGKKPGRPGTGRAGNGASHTPEVMLRSWVQTGGEHDPEPDPEAAARRTATDRAGVDRAVAYERDAGRNPTEMPHDNEGYDIESRVEGEIVRFIEVKAQSGPWRNNAPSLSKKQHEHAVEKKDQYWLYVVELAGHPGEELHTIQDPIGQATHFGFDPGWRAVAFDPEGPYDELDDEIAPSRPPGE